MASCGNIVLTDLGRDALDTFPREVSDLTDGWSGLPKVKPGYNSNVPLHYMQNTCKLQHVF